MKKKNNFGAGIFTGMALMIAIICLSYQGLFILSYTVFSGAHSINFETDTVFDYGDGSGSGNDEDYHGIASADAIELFNEKITNIADIISKNYLFDYDPDLLMDGMLKGYVRALGDKYSEFITAEEIAAREEMESDEVFGGIGASITYDDSTGQKTVSSIRMDSPAKKGGMQVGDIIYKVDGEDVTSLSLEETVSRVRGEAGTDVEIVVIRDRGRISLKLTREEIHEQIVTSYLYESGIGYIHFSEFSDESEEQIREALESLINNGMKGLIIDVRYNSGGGVKNAVNIVNMFVEKDKTVTVLKDKNGNEEVYKTPGSPICDVPVIVVVNGQSISAAELFAGAMRDLDRAVLLGEKTYGKGVAQNSYSLNDSDGNTIGLLKITTDYYYLPNGECINGVGISPEIAVEEETTEDGDDKQILKAYEMLEDMIK